MILTCKQCGKEWNATNRKRKYCSMDCRNKSYKGKCFSPETQFKKGRTLSKEEIDKKRAKLKGRKMPEHVRQILIEENRTRVWTKEMRKARSKMLKEKWKTKEYRDKQVKVHTGKKYPHNTGENHWKWKGGGKYYRGSGWIKRRTEILERDNYQCKLCGMTNEEHNFTYGQNLHIHHIVPYVESKDNSDSNLMTLCVKCHTREEHEYEKSQGRLGLKKKRDNPRTGDRSSNKVLIEEVNN